LKLIAIFAIIGKKLMQVKRDPIYLSGKITTNENDKTTYCKCFDNSCYHHQWIANSYLPTYLPFQL